MSEVEKRTGAVLGMLAEEINAEHRAFVGTFSKTIEHGIRAGELLAEAKTQCSHGTWLPWLEENFEGAARTAQEYMRLYNHRDEIRANTRSPAHLSVSGALKELSSPQLKPLISLAKTGNEDDVPADLVEIVEQEWNPAADAPTDAEKAWNNFSGIMKRLHELAAGVDMAGGIAKILRHQPEQNQRIFVHDYRVLAERALEQVEAFEQLNVEEAQSVMVCPHCSGEGYVEAKRGRRITKWRK